MKSRTQAKKILDNVSHNENGGKQGMLQIHGVACVEILFWQSCIVLNLAQPSTVSQLSWKDFGMVTTRAVPPGKLEHHFRVI